MYDPKTYWSPWVYLDQRAKLGITPGLVRVSVGIEGTEDLVADVLQGLDEA